MANMGGELNYLLNNSNDTLGSAGHMDYPDFLPDSSTTMDANLAGAYAPEQLWETPSLENFQDAPSPVILDFPASRVQPAKIGSRLSGDEDDVGILTLKAPPIQAGLTYAPTDSSHRVHPSAAGPSNSYAHNAFVPESFPGLDVSNGLHQLDANADFDQHLTEGLTASPGRSHALPDMSVFASGNADRTYPEPLTNAPQHRYNNSYFAMPNENHAIAPVQSGGLTALPGFGPTIHHNQYGLNRTNLDHFTFFGPATQHSPVASQYAPGSVMVPRLARYNLPVTASAEPVYDAMQEPTRASAPSVGIAHPQPRPVRLYPAGKFNLAPPRTGLAISAPPTPRHHKARRQGTADSNSASTRKTRTSRPDPTGFTKEAAKFSSKKSWVRVNDRVGANSRGGKLNEYDPELYYTKIPPPSDWKVKLRKKGKINCEVNRYVFEYDQDGELSEECYSAKQIYAYLRFHNKKRGEKGSGELRVWIQKTPADCARRYEKKSSSECRFKECPLRQIGQRATIWQGHLRVAFDENYTTHCESTSESRSRQVIDPFANAGYCHLYCFERFLDLPSLLDVVTIKLDDRNIDTEPNREYPCRLAPGDTRYAAAVKFMAETEDGVLQRFPNQYPPHQIPDLAICTNAKDDGDNANLKAPIGPAKDHNATLNGVMQQAYVKSWHETKLRKERERGSHSTLSHTLGDLDLHCAAKWPHRWRALQEGKNPLKMKEPPKYLRARKGSFGSQTQSSGKDADAGRGGVEKRKRKSVRVVYVSETEDEDEDEAEVEETGDEDDDLDDDDGASSSSASDSLCDRSEDERQTHKKRKLGSTGRRVMLRNGKVSGHDAGESTVHVRPRVEA